MKPGFRIGDWVVDPARSCIERNSESIHLAPKAMAVLVRLAEAHGQVVSRQAFFDSVWRGCDVTDDALTQRVSEIRKAFGDSSRDPAVIETVPKVGFRLIPPAVPLDAAGSTGIHASAIRRPTRGSLRVPALFAGPVAVILALLLARALLNDPGGDAERRTEGARQTAASDFDDGAISPATGAPDRRSVAVLPFVSNGTDSTDVNLAEAIHEEVLTRLARANALKVISRASVEAYVAADKPIAGIAKDLSVATVVTGSVQQQGNELRVRVQLVDVESGRYLWARSFDRELTASSVLSIQREIADSVARSLNASLGDASLARASDAPQGNMEAYWSLLKGRSILAEGTRASMRRAIQHYEDALRIDPAFARAYLEMADAYWLGVEQLSIPETEAMARIEEYSVKALNLDPDLGLALANLGHVKRNMGHYEEAEILFRRALEREPGNARAMHGLGLTLRLAGRAPEAVRYYDRAVEIAPFSPIINESRGSLLRDLGRFEEAESQYRSTIAFAPDFVNSYWGLGTLYWSMGNPEQAAPWFEAAIHRAPQSDVFRTWLALMYLELGRDRQAQAAIDDALRTVQIDSDNDIVMAEELAHIYRGEDSSALPDGRYFMSRHSYGQLLGLPARPLLAGRFAAAIGEYERAFPGISSGDAVINATNLQAAVYVAFSLKRLGRTEQALGLLDRAEAQLENLPRLGMHGYGITDAQIQAIRGDQPGAMRRLETAVRQGWRNLWRFYLQHDPVLRELEAQPGYDTLVAQVRSDMTGRVGTP